MFIFRTGMFDSPRTRRDSGLSLGRGGFDFGIHIKIPRFKRGLRFPNRCPIKANSVPWVFSVHLTVHHVDGDCGLISDSSLTENELQ